MVYGHAVESVPVQVSTRELSKAVRRAGKSHLLQLRIAGERRQRPVLIKELQVSPRTAAMVHVDFFQVNLTEKLTVEVQVVLTGEAPAVKLHVGELLQVVHDLEVSCLPDSIPGEITVDISSLAEIDDAVRLSDITFPEGVEVASTIDPGEILVKISQPRVVAAAAVELEPGAPSAEGEGSAEPASAGGDQASEE